MGSTRKRSKLRGNGLKKIEGFVCLFYSFHFMSHIIPYLLHLFEDQAFTFAQGELNGYM
jgi:hypothetical protein